MGKIQFDEKGNNFIEIALENKQIVITLSSQDSYNSKKAIINSVCLSIDEFNTLLKDIKGDSKDD